VRKPDIMALFREGDAIQRALNQAVREALLVHKRLGQSIAIWRDGRVVVLPASEIPIDGEGNDTPAQV